MRKTLYDRLQEFKRLERPDAPPVVQQLPRQEKDAGTPATRRVALAMKSLAGGCWRILAAAWHIAEAVVWLLVVLVLIVLALAVAHKLGVQLPPGLEKALNFILKPLKEVINHV